MTEKLNGRYELGDVVGAGGMGAVYRATDTRLGRTVAIKALRGGALADEVARARMRSEARLASTVHHPGVAQIYDYDDSSTTHGGMAFIVMEYVDGQSLSQLLRDRGPLPVDEVMSIVRQVAEALTAAHSAGVVHRDLKPANIMLTSAGRAVLVDFGIASSATSDPLTDTGALIGTADYLSPEQASGRSATPRSDLYALGVVAYQCLTGVSPFRRDHHVATALAHLQEDLPALDASVPPRVRELVRRLAEKNPVDRPTDAREVAREAAAIGAASVVDVPTATAAMPAPSSGRARRRRPVALYAGAGLVVAAALLLGVGRLTGNDASPPATDVAPVEQAVATSTVDVSADRLIGTPADEATALLERLGLVVQRRDVPSAGAAGLVIGVDRTGQVPLGTTVTIDVAVTPATPSPSAPTAEAPSSGGTAVSTGSASSGTAQGPGSGAATPNEPSKAKAPAQAKGNGKGKGAAKGNGKGKGPGKG